MTTFWQRNQHRFGIAAGVAGGIYALYKYAEYQFRQMELRMEVERAAKANLKLRFEQNQKDCSFTVLRLLPTLVQQIYPELDVESITSSLQQQRSAASSGDADAEALKRKKMEMWKELKSLSFTRTLSAIYLVTLLTVFTHLQLNLLGRFIYLDSVAAQAATRRLEGRIASAFDLDDDETVFDDADPDSPGKSRKSLAFETERKYLTFSWHLLNVGWRKCVEEVRKAVNEVVGSTPLSQQINFETMIGIITQVRAKVEQLADGTPSLFVAWLLPQEGQEAEVLREGGTLDPKDPAGIVDPQLKRLLDETRDFMDSNPDYPKVLKACLDQSFQLLEQLIRPTFFPDEVQGATSSAVKEVTEAEAAQISTEGQTSGSKSMPLAATLPAISRLVNPCLNSEPNLFVDPLIRALAPLNNPYRLAPTVFSLAVWGAFAGITAGFFLEPTPIARRDIFQNIPLIGFYWKEKLEAAERKD